MRKKASITVFAALSLMLVAQLLFTLLEAARHYELQKVLYMNTDTVLESVFCRLLQSFVGNLQNPWSTGGRYKR